MHNKTTKYLLAGLFLPVFLLIKGCEKEVENKKDLAVLTTRSVTQITSSKAQSGGNITDDGNDIIEACGIVWHTDSLPTIDSHTGKTASVSESGEFTSEITGLTPGTSYYVRAWATNSKGTAYGNQQTFTSAIELAGITTGDVQEITSTSARATGEVTHNGGSDITEKGIVWHTEQGPTLENFAGKNDHGPGTGDFSSEITGLSPGTTYHLRAYAINAMGVAYGNDISFTTPAVLPTLETGIIDSITSDSASVTGNVLNDGGAEILQKGAVWATFDQPLLENNQGIWNAGAGTGEFTAKLSELLPETVYYVRAFATNETGTAYGQTISFTTLTHITPPTVITHEVTHIANNKATGGGNIVEAGGAPVIERGVVYSLNPEPNVNDQVVKSRKGLGTFISLMTGLEPETSYYVKAYAINSAGIAYGEQVEFTTLSNFGQPCPGSPTVTDIEGNIYNTVLIGDQCWMKEDLKTITYNDGNPITDGTSGETWATNEHGAYTWYEGNEEQGRLYGVIYNFHAVNTGKLCPTGWWVPSNEEWTEMTGYLLENIENTTSENISHVLKSCRQENSPLGGDCNTNEHPRWDAHDVHFGTNETGFSALPGGSRNYTGNYFYGLGNTSYWWTSSQMDATTAWHRRLKFDDGIIHGFVYDKGNGYMVRCIKK